MILDEYVEITVNKGNYKYFEKLGYYVEKHLDSKKRLVIGEKGVRLFVKQIELPPNSKEMIHISCDGCGKEYFLRKINYTQTLKRNNCDLYYCVSCATENTARKNIADK